MFPVSRRVAVRSAIAVRSPRALRVRRYTTETAATTNKSSTQPLLYVVAGCLGAAAGSYLSGSLGLSYPTAIVSGQPRKAPTLDLTSPAVQNPRTTVEEPHITPEEISAKIREKEATYVSSELGVKYYVSELGSNSVSEDNHSEAVVQIPGGGAWGFWGIYDGHVGSEMSAMLSKSLISFVTHELQAVYSEGTTPTAEAIDTAIKRGFTKLDDIFMKERLETVLNSPSPSVSINGEQLSFPAAHLLKYAMQGSCALLSFYESATQNLRVAVVGDSRAVLGRRGENGWTATALTRDQTGSNTEEADRLRREHPGEEADVVKNGRVMGKLEVTRAFGDYFFKWDDETKAKIEKNHIADLKKFPTKTAPYVTAEPIVTTVKLQPEKGDFVVLACDGLWETLSSEEVVGLVGRWVDEQQAIGKEAGGSGWEKWIPKQTAEPPAGMKAPEPMGAPDERFVMEDKNVATHLIRNGLGGKVENGDILRAVLTLQNPLSRNYRDDLTVEVIFFGQK